MYVLPIIHFAVEGSLTIPYLLDTDVSLDTAWLESETPDEFCVALLVKDSHSMDDFDTDHDIEYYTEAIWVSHRMRLNTLVAKGRVSCHAPHQLDYCQSPVYLCATDPKTHSITTAVRCCIHRYVFPKAPDHRGTIDIAPIKMIKMQKTKVGPVKRPSDIYAVQKRKEVDERDTSFMA